MGYFLTIVAQSLDVRDGDFVQTVNVLRFADQVFVSWSPTQEEPDQNENWYWLAANTLRFSKQADKYFENNTYRDTPVARRSDGQLVYKWEWANYSGNTIIHLALPTNFIADLESLHSNMPAYIKVNRGRLCLGWLPSSEAIPAYTFNIFEVTEDFQSRVEEFVDQFEALKREESPDTKVAHARKLSTIFKLRLQHLEEQMAIYGRANVPFHIRYDLDETRTALEEQLAIIAEYSR